MDFHLITALFDIDRESKGDGRKIEDYLQWFEKTLKIKGNIIVYTEDKFLDFVYTKSDPDTTKIIVQEKIEMPFYKYLDKIEWILNSDNYIKKIDRPDRIECRLGLYNVIQYSKFGWIEDSIKFGDDDDFYFWVDAGISRFFDGIDIEKWEINPDVLEKNKINIQGNCNTSYVFNNIPYDQYKLKSDAALVGTFFGGTGKMMRIFRDKIEKILNELLEEEIVNNEQIALALLMKREPDLFNVKIHLDGTHLPILKIVNKK